MTLLKLALVKFRKGLELILELLKLVSLPLNGLGQGNRTTWPPESSGPAAARQEGCSPSWTNDQLLRDELAHVDRQRGEAAGRDVERQAGPARAW